jgi:hypothetical protein
MADNENALLAAQQAAMVPTFAEKMKMSEILAQSGIIPQAFVGHKENILVALQMGQELGLAPMASLRCIYVVNGIPTLSTDTMNAIAHSCHDYAGAKWIKENDTEAEVIVCRKCCGVIEEHTGRFTIDDAKKAGLDKKDTWIKYPERMLKHRALSYALRDAFPDKLAGIYTNDEASEFAVSKPQRNVTPHKAEAEENEDPTMNSGKTKSETQGATGNEAEIVVAKQRVLAIMGHKYPDGSPTFTEKEVADTIDNMSKEESAGTLTLKKLRATYKIMNETGKQREEEYEREAEIAAEEKELAE